MALRIDDVDLQRDRRLVERFQEGDDTAFETLYLRYFARLQRFCLKRVGDPIEAEEIAQEAFTRAYRALPALAGERRFYPWMTVIAGRLCVDHHRRRSRTEPSDSVELGWVDGGQEAIVEQSEFALLTKAIDRLAPRHREVLEMREHRGWSYQQIATHYDVPVGTVEALLFRARKALKREFIAIAGSDRAGGFAALPVLCAAFRKWGLLKAKIGGWASALPPAVAPALGVAAVVGSAAAMGATVLPESGSASRPPAVVRLVQSAPASASADLGVSVTTVTPSSASASATASPGAAPSNQPAPPPVAVGPILRDDAVTTNTERDRREQAEDPVKVGADGAGHVSAHADQVVSDVLGAGERWFGDEESR